MSRAVPIRADSLPASSTSSPRLGQKRFDHNSFSGNESPKSRSNVSPPPYSPARSFISDSEKRPPSSRPATELTGELPLAKGSLRTLITFGPFRERLPILLAACLFSTICGLIPPYMTDIIGAAFGIFAAYAAKTDNTTSGHAASSFGAELISETRIIAFKLLGLAAAMLLASTLASSLWVVNGERTSRSVRQEFQASVTRKPMSWFDTGCGMASNNASNDDKEDSSAGPAGLVGQFTKCTDEVRLASSQNMGQLVQYLVCFLACLTLSFVREYRLTFVILASIPIITFVTIVTERLSFRWVNFERELSTQASNEADRILGAFTTVKAFSTERIESERFGRVVRKGRDAYIKLHFIWGIRTGFSQFLLLAMFVQGFWFGSWLVKTGRSSAQAVNTCFYAVLLATNYLQACIPLLVNTEKGKIAIRRMQDTIQDAALDGPVNISKERNSGAPQCQTETPVSPSFPPLVRLSRNAQPMRKLRPKTFSGEISLRHVTFWYPSRPAPSPAVLRNVSLYFAPRETTFVVGASGSGKSTVSSLITGLYQPHDGRVELDEQDRDVIDERWIGSVITCVSQGAAFLINGSLHDNVALGIVGALDEHGQQIDIRSVTRERVVSACRFALLHEFINDLPEGYDTYISGEKDSALSGGQRQRLALARAWIRDSKVLILDEATAALDLVTRGLIHDAIRKWRANKTTIIITHDLSPIQSEDFVYVLDDGENVQHGYRSALEKERDGRLARLLSLQSAAKDSSSSDPTADIDAVPSAWSERDRSYLAIAPTDVQRHSESRRSAFLGAMTSLARPLSVGIWGQMDESWQSIRERRQRVPRMAQLEQVTTISAATRSTTTAVNRPREGTFQLVKRAYAAMPSKTLLVIGCLLSAVVGACTPVFSSLLSQVMASIGNPSSTANITELSLIIFAVALVDGSATFLKFYVLERCAMNWISMLRQQGLDKLLAQDKSWFDDPAHSIAKIGHLLIKDTEDARTLVGTVIGQLFVVVTMLLLGLVWALTVGWQLTLVGVAIAPVLLLLTRLQASFYGRYEEKNKSFREDLSLSLHQNFTNIKGVRDLCVQSHLDGLFNDKLEKTYTSSLKVAPIAGIGVGLANSLAYAVEALMFYVSALLIASGKYTYGQMMQVFTLVIFSVTFAGQIMSYLPAMTRALQACRDLTLLRDLQPSAKERKGTAKFTITGFLQFREVDFAFPSRPDKKILRGLSLGVQAGECIALVGASGCGKSTLVQLLQRFYEPDCGEICLDGLPLDEMDVTFLRQQMAVVSQQPSLFDMTVQENIAYGAAGRVTEAEIIRAAKLAQVHDFIASLPDGYATRLGHNASLLSGGQVQRLQLARALVRRCKILILDECTSALDAANQAAVLESIARAKVGRTTIIITHKLDVMRMADRIVLLKDGDVAETGAADDFMARGGLFAELARGGEWL